MYSWFVDSAILDQTITEQWYEGRKCFVSQDTQHIYGYMVSGQLR